MPEKTVSQKTSPHEVRTLFEWRAPGRPFKKRTRQYYLSSILIMLLIEVILFLFSQYTLMLVVLSLVFVVFALSAVPPRDFYYKISTEGIMVEDTFFIWKELYDFYFKKEYDVDVLHVGTKSFLPGEITLTINDKDKETIKKIILPYLPFREYVKPDFMEKSGNWLAKNFPLENE